MCVQIRERDRSYFSLLGERWDTPVWVCSHRGYTHMELYFFLEGQHANCWHTSLCWPAITITVPWNKLRYCVHCLMSMFCSHSSIISKGDKWYSNWAKAMEFFEL